jgi:integrase
VANIAKRPDGAWRARYRDETGRQHARHFARKTDAQRWLDEQTAKLVTGTHVAPRTAKTTVGEWCDIWLEGYGTRRKTTVRQAEVHILRIKAAFGHMRLGGVRPSHVKTWCSQLAAEGLADSYVYALHARLAQLYADAIEDGLVAKSPCSRKTSPKAGKQRPYVATEAQVWALYDVFPEHLRAAVLLGAFMGARDGEACGVAIDDLDLMRGIWHPTAQYPAEPLKTETSKTAVPFGQVLALELAKHIQVTLPLRRGDWLLCNEWGQQLAPWGLQRAMRAARAKILGLPADFRYQDLRHYFASMLIRSGADVKVVQARLRHASAKTTLDTYSHLWPDSDDSTRAAIDAAMTARGDFLGTSEAQ